uniref:Syntrophin, gamma 2 n=1 Tax=Sinocyclocheilus rhinocerous TaxID=307959 RepID=A0A673I6G5_9TELE
MSSNMFVFLLFQQMKTGLALLYDEHTSNTYDVRLKLTKELLIIQKQDVVCVSGGDSHLNVHLLRTAGDEVTITVRYLREAPAFLKLPLGSPGPSSDQSSRASSPLFDSGLHLNGNSSNTAPSSPSSPSANEPKYEKRWLDAVSLPLFMARISRRKAATDKLRSNSFEVIALDGVCTHVLQFCTAAESTDWLQAISTNINDLTQESMGFFCRFLALRGSSLLVFRSPPVSSCITNTVFRDVIHVYTTLSFYDIN